MAVSTRTGPLYQGRHCSYPEAQALPDDKYQYEIVQGVMRMVPAPFFNHQNLVGKLYRAIDTFLDTRPIGVVTLAPRDVKLSENLVYQPDILFIAKERLSINTPRYVDGAPDFIVEVISRGTVGIDSREKFAHYQQHGVREYWIMDPNDVFASEFYCLTEGQYQRVGLEANIIQSQVIDGFSLDLAQLEQQLRSL